jgi:5'-nucleotidase
MEYETHLMKTILITNDDGLHGPGLSPLERELSKIARVIVIVPHQERSATSHSITLHKPIRVDKLKKNMYVASGTPADCVRYGILAIASREIDLVVSGVNAGPNLGQDVVYSGTVAGAREGALMGIPSIAISTAELIGGNFKLASVVALKLARLTLERGLPGNTYLNVNVPKKIKKFEITVLGKRIYDEKIECRTDPRGQKYYWLAGRFVSGIKEKGTDIGAVESSHVSITPLLLNPVDKPGIREFEKWITNLS